MVDDKLHDAALKSEFKVVWEILNALMEQDADLADAVVNLGKLSGTEHHHTFCVYDPLFKFMNINASDTLKELISVRIIGKLVPTWDKMFARLVDYKEKHGSTKIDLSIDVDLYKWANKQRREKEELSDPRRNRLNYIGFDWARAVPTWDERYDILKEFFDKYGKIPNPREQNRSLVAWIDSNRQQHFAGNLAIDKLEKLKALGINFTPEDKRNEDLWQLRYSELLDYNNKNKSTHVPQRLGSLGKWCCSQRESYKTRTLLPHRQKLLEDIGFNFDPLETLWHNRYKQYKECVAAESKFPEELRAWMSYQRRAFARSALLPDKLKLLHDVNFDFTIVETYKTAGKVFESPHYKFLVEYKKEHGNILINSKKFKPVYKWMQRVIDKESLGKLSTYEKGILNKLGFNWDKGMTAAHALWHRTADEYAIAKIAQQPILGKLKRWEDTVHDRRSRGRLTGRERQKLLEINFEFKGITRKKIMITRGNKVERVLQENTG